MFSDLWIVSACRLIGVTCCGLRAITLGFAVRALLLLDAADDDPLVPALPEPEEDEPVALDAVERRITELPELPEPPDPPEARGAGIGRGVWTLAALRVTRGMEPRVGTEISLNERCTTGVAPPTNDRGETDIEDMGDALDALGVRDTLGAGDAGDALGADDDSTEAERMMDALPGVPIGECSAAGRKERWMIGIGARNVDTDGVDTDRVIAGWVDAGVDGETSEEDVACALRITVPSWKRRTAELAAVRIAVTAEFCSRPEPPITNGAADPRVPAGATLSLG
jgi:hypothetical protein